MFDGLSTLTLYASSFADIAGFAADPSRSTRRWAERQRGWC